MIRIPFESRDQVLYSTLPILSTISTLSSATLHQVKNSQKLQQFWVVAASDLFPLLIKGLLDLVEA